MNLIPQVWAWDVPHPHVAWLAKCPPDRPSVWQTWLTDDSKVCSHLVSLLSDEERARLAKFRLFADRQRFLIGRGLLRLLVGAHLNVPAARVLFDYGPFGKPRVVPPAGAASLHCNVSHSGRLVLLAFHPRQEVGVDVEEVRRVPDLEGIARQVFPPEAHRAWRRLNPAQQLTAFYRAWTRNEAGLKAMGTGFSGERCAALPASLHLYELILPEGYLGAAGCLDSTATAGNP